MKKYLSNFWWKHNIIILEWEQETKPFLLTNEKKLIALEKLKDWQLLKHETKTGIFLTTFLYRDKSLGSCRFIGDAYWHEAKKRYVAILWLTGPTKNKLEKETIN
ncbi:MAG: hypothetical protein MRERV_12c007 [Mycoplasmataceae bacterium RV_VA103A]|nr:MAG: hypothetical protein MRERV_12c007 [Mycoplasmataceae bacterium RV_VA103A]